MTKPGSSTRRPVPGIGTVLTLLCALAAGGLDAGRLYRWVDADGNVHYTDRMPAEAADAAHTVMDGSGAVVDHRDTRAAERERQRRPAAAEAERDGRTERERQRAEEQRRDDRIIRQTFTTEREIEMTRENRVSAVQVQLNIADHGISRLEDRRGQLEQRLQSLPEDAAAAETTHERIGEIDTRLQQRRTERAALEDKRESIEQRFARYLERFRELHASRD